MQLPPSYDFSKELSNQCISRRGLIKRPGCRLITATLLVFFSFGETRTSAQELSADDIIIHMDGICIQNILRIDAVGAIVTLMGGAAMPKEHAAGFAPIDGELLGAWHIESDGQPFFIATAHNAQITPATSSCTLITTFDDPEEIVERFKSIYDISNSKEEQQGFQRYTTYEIAVMDEKMIISFNQGLHPSTQNILAIGAIWPIE